MTAPADLRYEITPDDIAAFGEHHHAHAPSARRSTRPVYLGFPALWLFIFALGALDGDSSLAWVWLSLLWLVVVPRIGPRIAGRAMRRKAERGTLPFGSTGACSLHVDDRAITETGPHTTLRTLWSGVDRVEEGPEHVFVYIGADVAVVVPARAFASAEEHRGFVEFVRRRVGAKPVG